MRANINKYQFQKLTPIKNADLKIYKDALDFAFHEEDIRNIAVTGPYSAGKSSTLETYEENNPNIKFLNISLAHFEEGNGSQEDRTDVSDATLEGKILNQLIHQITPDKIPLTQFKVKRHVSKLKLVITSTFLSIFFVLSFYIFTFNKWKGYVESISNVSLKNILGFSTKDITLILAGVVWLLIASYFIFTLIKLIQHNRIFLRKLKLQGNEIEIFEEMNESFFDKYLT